MKWPLEMWPRLPASTCAVDIYIYMLQGSFLLGCAHEKRSFLRKGSLKFQPRKNSIGILWWKTKNQKRWGVGDDEVFFAFAKAKTAAANWGAPKKDGAREVVGCVGKNKQTKGHARTRRQAAAFSHSTTHTRRTHKQAVVSWLQPIPLLVRG